MLEATRATRRSGPVEWEIPVDSRTIHRLEGLLQCAEESAASVRLVVDGQLDERQRAVLADCGPAGRQALGLSPAGRSRFGQLAVALRWALRWMLYSVRPHRRRRERRGEVRRVVLIGAYGGDHVGDTAILGGVLLTLAAREGVTDATVLSHRAAHTARLAAGLETPVALAVADYDSAAIGALLDRADALVVAGGPLMDLPRVLLRHLAVTAAARARGLPIWIERVGLGPFRRAASRFAVRSIVRGAERVSLRSSAAADDPLVRGRAVEVGRDPAFDYLASRAKLGKLRSDERTSLAELLASSAGRPRIGINLRPIRHLWSRRGRGYSQAAYESFLDRFASAMIAASDAAATRPCFIFFPMNPIRFGYSDLEAAYQLQRRLRGRAELRVWEADPDVDGLLHLLRQLDGAVAMRLHAAIFALSQGLPVLGLDYYPGQGGKVEQLFTDLGRPEAVRRIDAFEVAWLVEGLSALRPRGADHEVPTRMR